MLFDSPSQPRAPPAPPLLVGPLKSAPWCRRPFLLHGSCLRWLHVCHRNGCGQGPAWLLLFRLPLFSSLAPPSSVLIPGVSFCSSFLSLWAQFLSVRFCRVYQWCSCAIPRSMCGFILCEGLNSSCLSTAPCSFRQRVWQPAEAQDNLLHKNIKTAINVHYIFYLINFLIGLTKMLF